MLPPNMINVPGAPKAAPTKPSWTAKPPSGITRPAPALPSAAKRKVMVAIDYEEAVKEGESHNKKRKMESKGEEKQSGF